MPEEIIELYFGFKIKSAYFPFLLMGINFLMEASLKGDILGLIVGHMFIVVKDILPASHQKNYLKTPDFL